ncbi:MAG: hypothetical protein Kow0059_09090 [Candidatus Sumerlaeia bacterium]
MSVFSMKKSPEINIKPHPYLPPAAAGMEPTVSQEWERESATPGERMYARRHRLLLNLLVPLLLGLMAFGLVLATADRYGLSWDEAYYFDPFVKAGDWAVAMAAAADKPVSAAAIDSYFDDISELPAVPKIAFGLCYHFLAPLFGPLNSVRVLAYVSFALLVALIYLFTRQYFGPVAGVAAALLYLFTPRAFGHAHLAATESFTALVFFVTLWVYIKGIGRRWRWCVAAGVLLGVALATRVNCLLLPLILLLWSWLYYKDESVNNLYAVLFLTPVAMFLSWPWLWPDPLMRLAEYLEFFTKHEYVATAYLGRIYNQATGPAPWHYPFVMLAVTLPLGHLFIMTMGVGLLMWKSRRLAVGALVLVAIGVQLFFAAWPSAPKYDGVRLFFPVLSFLAVAGGVAFAALCGYTGMIDREVPRIRFVLMSCLLALTLATAAWKMLTLPSALLYFNALKSLVAVSLEQPALAFDESYWGETFNDEMIEALDALPPGARVRTLAMHRKVPLLLQRWGRLRRDLVFNGPPPYDYHVLQFRPSFFARPELTLFNYYTPIKAVSADGLPVMMLYQTGPQFETLWPKYPDITRE